MKWATDNIKTDAAGNHLGSLGTKNLECLQGQGALKVKNSHNLKVCHPFSKYFPIWCGEALSWVLIYR